jgi:putative ABC transport system substrate-binding protein
LLQDYLFLAHRQKIAEIALQYKTPTIYGFLEHVEAGGLASYGADLGASWHRAAAFVDKILKGSHAGDLPVEFPTKMEASINMKTAYLLGLEVRSSILARADNVLE